MNRIIQVDELPGQSRMRQLLLPVPHRALLQHPSCYVGNTVVGETAAARDRGDRQLTHPQPVAARPWASLARETVWPFTPVHLCLQGSAESGHTY